MAATGDSFGGAQSPPITAPSAQTLRWFIGLRLVVVSTLFVGVLIIQVTTQQILQLRDFYGLILLTYGLSLAYLVIHLRRLATRLQAVIQLLGDIAVVTGVVYFTGGLYSPFSFLYLAVIVAAAVLLRGGGLVFAGLSAVTYGVMVDLMAFEILPIPSTLEGIQVAMPTSRILYQILIHVAGFSLVALLVSYLSESLRTTRHRLAEESERTRQFVALTDHVVRSVSAGILATDLDGRVLHVNPAGARILGLSEEDEYLGRPMEEIMPIEELNWGLLRSRARERTSQRLEGHHRITGARLGLAVGPLEDEEGTLVGFISNFQDLTVVEVEAQRSRQRERMAATGEMAARMAHEIKNPLAAISGSAQVLVNLQSLDPTGQRLLSIVVDESQRLSSILDGFLQFTRPGPRQFGRCDLAALLRDCFQLLERSPETRSGHRLTLDVPEQLEIEGDAHLLRQIFWNLSRNALQAMPEGGELDISALTTELSVVLRWRDSGCGMTEEVLDRAFEPFVTSHAGGTGLGLAVVYAAAQEHGGSVDIVSAPGEGSAVTVELPKRAEEA